MEATSTRIIDPIVPSWPDLDYVDGKWVDHVPSVAAQPLIIEFKQKAADTIREINEKRWASRHKFKAGDLVRRIRVDERMEVEQVCYGGVIKVAGHAMCFHEDGLEFAPPPAEPNDLGELRQGRGATDQNNKETKS